MALLRFTPDNTSFDFIGKRWLAFALSLGLIIGSFGMLLGNGLNLGIDFTGGIVIEARAESPIDIAPLRTVLTQHIEGDVALQHFGSNRDVLIRIQVADASTSGKQSAVVIKAKELLNAHIGPRVDYRKIDYVGPQVSSELLMGGAMALGFAFLAILVYIWFRFEWQFGVGAVVALIHDTILTLGFFSLLGIEFNLSSIAAILTIIGYSINDSVVIYDRIRENLRKYKKQAIADILNRSINNTLSRTILTAGSTIAALLALVYFGGSVIQGFSLAVLFGVIVGTYSSIYVAAPILIYINLRAPSPTDHSDAEGSGAATV